MKISKHLLVTIVLALSSIGIVANTNSYAAAQSELACQGLEDVAGDACGTSTGDPTINGIIKFALNLLSFIAGFIAVFMLIIAGLRYITSQGSPEATKGAQSAIIYAVIGLVIVVLAQAIVQFVLNRATVPPDSDEDADTSMTIESTQQQSLYRV